MDAQQSTHRASFEKLLLDADKARAQRFRQGASWFYWIAALSVLNSAILWLEIDWSFLIGLATMQLVDAAALFIREAFELPDPAVVTVIALALDIGIVGLFVLFGYFARKGYSAAFAIGIFLYVADGLLGLLLGDWLGTAFHALALYFLWRGFSALRTLRTEGGVVPA